jgi:hypothetical protein
LCLDIQRAAHVIGPRADLTACLNVITSPRVARRQGQWLSVTSVTKPGGFALIVVPSIESACMIAGVDSAGPTTRSGSAMLNDGLVGSGVDLRKHYSRRELRATLIRQGLIVHTIRRVFYPWAQESLPQPRDATAPYPWDWVCLARRPRSLGF